MLRQKIDAEADITITFEDGLTDLYNDNLSDGKFTKFIQEGIPTSLTIRCANKQARRRIFMIDFTFFENFLNLVAYQLMMLTRRFYMIHQSH